MFEVYNVIEISASADFLNMPYVQSVLMYEGHYLDIVQLICLGGSRAHCITGSASRWLLIKCSSPVIHLKHRFANKKHLCYVRLNKVICMVSARKTGS